MYICTYISHMHVFMYISLCVFKNISQVKALTLRKILTVHYSYLTQTPLNAIIVVDKKGFDYSCFENKIEDRRLGCQITITFSVSYAMF